MNLQQGLSNNFSFSDVTGTIKFLSWGDAFGYHGYRIGNAMLIQIQPDPQAPTGYNFVRK